VEAHRFLVFWVVRYSIDKVRFFSLSPELSLEFDIVRDYR
jgi:hypothetical protein